MNPRKPNAIPATGPMTAPAIQVLLGDEEEEENDEDDEAEEEEGEEGEKEKKKEEEETVSGSEERVSVEVEVGNEVAEGMVEE